MRKSFKQTFPMVCVLKTFCLLQQEIIDNEGVLWIDTETSVGIYLLKLKGHEVLLYNPIIKDFFPSNFVYIN